jgi:hypothetical protein
MRRAWMVVALVVLSSLMFCADASACGRKRARYGCGTSCAPPPPAAVNTNTQPVNYCAPATCYTGYGRRGCCFGKRGGFFGRRRGCCR